MSKEETFTPLYAGTAVVVRRLEPGLYELCLDRQDESVNKFDDLTVHELRDAVQRIASEMDARGVLVTSAKRVFAVGADIGGLAMQLRLSEAEIAHNVEAIDAALDALEDLRAPTVAEINGFAVGGGLELALACTARVMSTAAQVGLPEVKLGLIPGAGGNVRLPRVAGVRTALEWITAGELHDASRALEAGVVDRVCAPDVLRTGSLEVLHAARSGKLDWQARRHAKCEPMRGAEAAEFLARTDSSAASAATQLMARCGNLPRNEALQEERREFARILKSPGAAERIESFILDQQKKRASRQAVASTQ